VGNPQKDFIWFQFWDFLGDFLDFAIHEAEDAVGFGSHVAISDEVLLVA
jgi:hypothetical protein